MQTDPIAIFWFRRDLRVEDNTGLYHCLRSGLRVLPVFIFDTDILDRLEQKDDRRISFIHGALTALQEKIKAAGSSLLIIHDTPVRGFSRIISGHNVKAVYANHDYEPYAVRRDQAVHDMLGKKGIPFHTFKDQVIFEKTEVSKPDRSPYTVFTPYSRAWKKRLTTDAIKSCPSEELTGMFVPLNTQPIPSVSDLGFIHAGSVWTEPEVRTDIIRDYHKTRDLPSREGTTRIGPHLRFGTVSIRKLVKRALELNDTWLNELIWREFFMSILWNFPYVAENSFRRKYDNIRWRNDEKEFELWCNGMTGYPMVDAGMRELNATGFMHNRARMITASFLAKHLLIDWRWGEAYFAEKLLDYELSSNNGNWQWAAGCGCDAAPYFRVFNPALQSERYDPENEYIRKWVPEYGSPAYPGPVVDHSFARERAIRTYREYL